MKPKVNIDFSSKGGVKNEDDFGCFSAVAYDCTSQYSITSFFSPQLLNHLNIRHKVSVRATSKIPLSYENKLLDVKVIEILLKAVEEPEVNIIGRAQHVASGVSVHD